MAAKRLLLVDDDKAFRSVYGELLRGEGYLVDEADDRNSASKAFAAGRHPVVLLDLMLPPDGTAKGGVAQLRDFIATQPQAKVIVVSGAGDTRSMLDAVAEGAYDFLTKPADPDVLLNVVKRAWRRFELERQLQQLRQSLQQSRPADSIIGDSPAFRAALKLAGQVAPTDLPVLVLGENGTGKEMLARLLHEKSKRRAQPFIAVNCGAIPEALFESTLFGHKKGAFSGAVKDHAGLFAAADGGSLFLDEIGDMPIGLQVKLLRTLESGEMLPVGAESVVRVDVRIISATNRDLGKLLQQETFRDDLYWRIKGAEIVLPPLRDRLSDIPLLAAFFLNQAATLALDGAAKRLSPEAELALQAHRWPGNLRELKHEMQRATVLAGTEPIIERQGLSLTAPSAGAAGFGLAQNAEQESLQQKIEALEKAEIARALTEFHDNRTHVARALGLSRQGLLKKMQRYGF